MGYPIIFLASRTEEANQILQRRLEPIANEFSNVRFVSFHTQGLLSSIDDSVDLVFLNFQDWSRTELSYLLSLREAGYMGPVIVLAKAKNGEPMKTLSTMEGVTLVEKPFETRDLIGITKKTLSRAVVTQRIYRRYETDEDAEVEFFGANDRFKSKVRNLSKGGAYLELFDDAAIKVGDILKLRLELHQVKRTYTLPAKVVWTGRSRTQSSQAVGVEFIGRADVKKTVLGI